MAPPLLPTLLSKLQCFFLICIKQFESYKICPISVDFPSSTLPHVINLSNPLILEIPLPLSSFHAACRLVVDDTGGSSEETALKCLINNLIKCIRCRIPHHRSVDSIPEYGNVHSSSGFLTRTKFHSVIIYHDDVAVSVYNRTFFCKIKRNESRYSLALYTARYPFLSSLKLGKLAYSRLF